MKKLLNIDFSLTDYDYVYPNNKVLKVELNADGNYKINYAT